MKRSIVIWSCILIPAVVLVVFIGQSLTPETGALAMGAILGLFAALVTALIAAIMIGLRDDRRARREQEAARRRPRSAAGDGIVEGEWREVAALPSTNLSANTRITGAGEPARAIEAPSRALTVR